MKRTGPAPALHKGRAAVPEEPVEKKGRRVGRGRPKAAQSSPDEITDKIGSVKEVEEEEKSKEKSEDGKRKEAERKAQEEEIRLAEATTSTDPAIVRNYLRGKIEEEVGPLSLPGVLSEQGDIEGSLITYECQSIEEGYNIARRLVSVQHAHIYENAKGKKFTAIVELKSQLQAFEYVSHGIGGKIISFLPGEKTVFIPGFSRKLRIENVPVSLHRSQKLMEVFRVVCGAAELKVEERGSIVMHFAHIPEADRVGALLHLWPIHGSILDVKPVFRKGS